MNRKLLFVVAVLSLVCGNNANAQIVGSDDFDGNGMFVSRTFNPDLSGSDVPGTFPGSNFDVFGIVDRTVNFDFADDTLMDPNFQGMFPTTITDNFFGTEDLDNGDNPDGTATLTYEFDVSGASDLSFSADFAAMGNFEAADSFVITASIDGSAPETLIELIAAEDTFQIYMFEDGSMTEETDEVSQDPLAIDGNLLSNFYQNFSAPITGSGNTLTVVFSFETNGSNEVVAIDNLLVQGKATKGLLGDVNCDGVVDLLDVAPFVDLVLSGDFNSKADINMDGVVDLLDVAPFVDLLIG